MDAESAIISEVYTCTKIIEQCSCNCYFIRTLKSAAAGILYIIIIKI